MTHRKQLIEEIMANSQAMKNIMHAKGAKDCAKAGITHSQLFVLAIIERHQNIGIKEISKKLNVSSSAATQLVDGLVANGFVTRKANLKDRRALRLALSAKGSTHIAALKQRRMRTMLTLFDALTDDELAVYLKLHKKILASITK